MGLAVLTDMEKDWLVEQIQTDDVQPLLENRARGNLRKASNIICTRYIEHFSEAFPAETEEEFIAKYPSAKERKRHKRRAAETKEECDVRVGKAAEVSPKN